MPRESKRARRDRAAEILRRLAATYPDSRCSLDHESPFQLLAATILSAQCTDALVNRVTPGLFARFPTPQRLADAPLEEIEQTIRQVNFFRNKAKALQGMARALVEAHGADVPRGMDQLTRLPGVGRKTANVVRGVAFGEADGVVVDTHVMRVSRRLGFTRHEEPERIEQELLDLVPPAERVVFTHRVIDHGRAVCVARTPRCPECPLAELCPSASFAGTNRRASRGPLATPPRDG